MQAFSDCLWREFLILLYCELLTKSWFLLVTRISTRHSMVVDFVFLNWKLLKWWPQCTACLVLWVSRSHWPELSAYSTLCWYVCIRQDCQLFLIFILSSHIGASYCISKYGKYYVHRNVNVGRYVNYNYRMAGWVLLWAPLFKLLMCKIFKNEKLLCILWINKKEEKRNSRDYCPIHVV